jgi:hypothetical protein
MITKEYENDTALRPPPLKPDMVPGPRVHENENSMTDDYSDDLPDDTIFTVEVARLSARFYSISFVNTPATV